ncbi:hypothetical protein PTSG_10083 [Salpingoeca rosetta]|uniref:COP9 signalosome complex subunit 6 n=1 Tax=Salpingoeca rosetta (strain ATCC 50818 / BSB-021) TaxID=946362 RepID=F2UPF7_SALR5|nr:uncharacterized protein PTSG_10083 [Salpingoeca rosetta]EGD79512.1 hypothetical protein PTSG_10083 [Salpingoeca rosetta]|eukprot:XP_004988993.1 hypothetical protein PTSG_10083 [Salpingoeca rosetta]
MSAMDVGRDDESQAATLSTDADTSLVVDGHAAATSLIQLHPMVILNISEHYTRIRMNQEDPRQTPPVLGAIYGTQSDRKLELCTSVAWATQDDGSLDTMLQLQLDEAVKRNFDNYELLGWYSIGTAPTEAHVTMHKKVCELTDSPLLLLLDPKQDVAGEALPVALYETFMEVRQDEQQLKFLKATFTIVTDEAERIGVDHIAKSGMHAQANQSQVEMQLTGQYNAIKMLSQRIAVIRNFLCAVKAGEVAAPRHVLRDLASLCSQLPVGAQDTLQSTLMKEMVDTTLAASLTEVTKALNTVTEMAQHASACKPRTKAVTHQRLF